MSDRYLWDKSGDVDPGIAELEHLLRPLGHTGRPGNLAQLRPVPTAPRWRRTLLPLALAASVVMAIGLAWMGSQGPEDVWSVEAVQGEVSVSGRRADESFRLAAGDRIETGDAGHARLRADGVGTLTLAPGSRLRVTNVERGRHWFALETGALDADIAAPPGVFAVDTPSARAVDLGCQYRLEVGPDGAGMLYVTLGWVGLEWRGRESLVPAGAMCAMRTGTGPGTPYFEGASPAFVESLAEIDRGGGAEAGHALDVVLAEARPLDAIALWHLLARVDPGSRERVYDRLAHLVPPPAGAGREAALRADSRALAAWWTAIGLGDLDTLRGGMVQVR